MGRNRRNDKNTRNRVRAFLLFVLAILLTVCPLTACRSHTEPEQIYLVSAMGFDRAESGIRVTVEIAMAENSKTEGANSAICFSQTGEDVLSALEKMTDGLPRALVFSHCALAVMGKDLTKAQMQEIFAFAGVEDGLPLAAEVVVSQNAEALLRGERLSAIAAGYEIPQILEQERARCGAELPCQIYRLRAVFSPDLPVALPRFDRIDGEMPTARFVGVDILRPDAPTYSLNASDCLPHAILTSTCNGGVESGIWWRVIREKWEPSEQGTLTLVLHLRMEGGEPQERDALAAELKRSIEALYQRVTEETEADLFWLGQRMGEAQWSRETALTVKCEVE